MGEKTRGTGMRAMFKRLMKFIDEDMWVKHPTLDLEVCKLTGVMRRTQRRDES